MAKNTERKVIIAAVFRDKMNEGIGKLRKGLKHLLTANNQTKKSNDSLRRSFKQTESQARILRKRLASLARTVKVLIAAFLGFKIVKGVLTSVWGVLRGTVDQLDKLAKTGKRLDITVEELSRLGYAAGRSGVEFETLSMATQRAMRRIAEFVKLGKGEAAGVLKQMGIQLTDIEGKMRPFTELLPEIADYIASIPEQGERVRVAMKLFDSEGVRLVQLLQDGGDTLRELFEDAEKYGAVLTAKQAEAAERISDAFFNINAATLGLRANVLEALADFLEVNLNNLASFIAKIEGRARSLTNIFKNAFDPKLSGEQLAEAEETMQGLIDRLWQVMTSVVEGISKGIFTAFAGGARLAGVVLARVFGEEIGNQIYRITGSKRFASPEELLAESQKDIGDIVYAKHYAEMFPDKVHRDPIGGEPSVTIEGQNYLLRYLDRRIAEHGRLNVEAINAKNDRYSLMNLEIQDALNSLSNGLQDSFDVVLYGKNGRAGLSDLFALSRSECRPSDDYAGEFG